MSRTPFEQPLHASSSARYPVCNRRTSVCHLWRGSSPHYLPVRSLSSCVHSFGRPVRWPSATPPPPQWCAIGEWKFPECHGLPRVPRASPSAKYRALGEEASPSALEPMALGEGPRSSPSATLGEERHSWTKRLFPECLPLAPGEESLFPECLALPLGEASLFPECLPLAVSSPSAMGRHPGNYFFFAPIFLVHPTLL
jgi:hypothetical protein